MDGPERRKKFDELLRDSLPELPPEDVVRQVSPWRRSMYLALAGLALENITINASGLNYILPAVGAFLLVLGLRPLRRENRQLAACWWTVAIRGLLVLVLIIQGATILRWPEGVDRGVTVLSYGLQLLQIFWLWRGLRAVRQRAGLEPGAGAGGALLVWNILIILLGLVGWRGGLILGLVLVAAYGMILYSLFRLSREMEEAGYELRPAAVRLSDRALAVITGVVVAAGLAAGWLWCGQLPMDWTPLEETGTAETEDIRQELIDLGFPESVLADLSEEDLGDCRGALMVVWDQDDYPVNDGREVVTREGNTTVYSTVYDVKELRVTGVAVKLPGERERWKVFHHFQWVADPGWWGTEAIQLWPAWHSEMGWSRDQAVTGRLLCERDGRTWTAPYVFLGPVTYTSNDFFSGTQDRTDIFASFSLPRNGENARGYVTYVTAEILDGCLLNSWMNYVHQTSWRQYPVLTALEMHLKDGWHVDGAFRTIQSQLLFSPSDGQTGFLGEE